MIGYLSGNLVTLNETTVLLRTSGGVGYEVRVPISVMAELVGSASAELHIVTVVRDDAIDLYGFHTPDAKALFKTLIQVSGIGPKAGLAMLSMFSPDELSAAIVTQDVVMISTVPGIGKKIATRLCVELGDRMAAFTIGSAGGTTGRGDLISALTNLGFTEKDVISALKEVPAGDTPFAEQLRSALAMLDKS